MQKKILLAAVLLLLFAAPLSAQDSASDVSQDIRDIVQNSVGFIDRGGTKWRKEKQCMSCHRGAFTVWALNRATKKGIRFDAEKLQDWNEWAADWQSLLANDKRKDADKEEVLLRENDAIAQLLLARSESSNAETLASFREHLLKSQSKDGNWKAGGQLPSQKRPKPETQQVTTMWSLVALADYAGPNDAKTKFATQKAMTWIGDSTKAESTEWWSVRLLTERFSAPTKADETRRKLIALQNQDGGWGWLHDDTSDALGTGIALYALAKSGAKPNQSHIASAIEFLKSTQKKNGGWDVRGTKSNRARKVTETASYWGTCWAVIGLLELQSF